MHIGRYRFFIGRFDAGELPNGALPCQRIQPLWVARFRDIQFNVDKDFEKLPGRKARARPGARFLERRDQGDDDDKPCIHHQACDLGRPTNILVAVCVAESQILIQSFAELVAIQQKRTKASSIELFLQEIR
ncbi:hypothetical protein WK01_09015 [Burkholderia cepacia]|nr:hypothetical protein WK01_09015 [Burkholderia cepacia]